MLFIVYNPIDNSENLQVDETASSDVKEGNF